MGIILNFIIKDVGFLVVHCNGYLTVGSKDSHFLYSVVSMNFSFFMKPVAGI